MSKKMPIKSISGGWIIPPDVPSKLEILIEASMKERIPAVAELIAFSKGVDVIYDNEEVVYPDPTSDKNGNAGC